MRTPEKIPEPWLSFLNALDAAAPDRVRLDCIGGFVITLVYGFSRPTGVPESYEDRVVEIFPGTFKHLQLFALDPYDLALSKLERNIQRDRDDVLHLARTIPFDLNLLRRRYRDELRWQLGNPEREDLTLQLWIDAIEEERAKG